jgi:hypothetical protein
MAENKIELLKQDPNREKALNVLSIVASAAPYLGGPVSAVLSGYVTSRKFDRMAEVIQGLAVDLRDFKSKVAEEYVKGEDFEDLLEQTLRKAAYERNEQKRKMYKNLLKESVKTQEPSYDEQLRILRVIEQLQPDHIMLIKALNQQPSKVSGFAGSPIQTLRERLPEFPEEHIVDLTTQLNDLRVTDLRSLKTMMTASGAQELRGVITDFGKRLLNYIEEK